MRHRFAGIFTSAFVLTLVGCGAEPAPEWNVLLVTLDTVRADRIGCYGYEAGRTPVLDGLAAEGVRFDQASTVAPLTLPAHTSMLTGLYPPSHGVLNNGLFRLPDGVPTVTERLQEAGFATAAILGATVLNREYGLARGFDRYDGVPTRIPKSFEPTSAFPERTADEITRRALEWLDAIGDRRFFLWAHYFDPHAPYRSHGSDERDPSALYDGEIAFADSAIGDLLRGIDERAGKDRTVVVVVADHGEALLDHGESSHGFFVYDEVMRVPFIIKAPGGKAGAVEGGIVSVVDVAPTILGLLGMDPLVANQGMDLSGTVLGSRAVPDDRQVYMETRVPYLEYGWSPLMALRTAGWKYILAPEPELYDLARDPSERDNLYPSPPAEDLAAEMSRTLARLRPVFQGNADHAPSEAELDRLRSLGYLQGDAGRSGSEADPRTLPDPKDMIATYRQYRATLDLISKGRHDEAVHRLQAILTQDPGNLSARQRLVSTLAAMGDLTAAETEASEGLEFLSRSGLPFETSIELRSLLATILERGGRPHEASRVLREVLDRDPDNLEVLRLRMFILLALGNREGALADARRLIELSPDDSELRSESVRLAVRAQDRATAIEWGLPLLGAGGDPVALEGLGDMLQQVGRLAEAEAAYRRGLERDDTLPRTWWGLGRVLFATGRAAEGIEAFRRGTEAAPAHPTAWYNLGLAALMIEDETLGREALARSLDLEPNNPDAHKSLARYLAERNRPREACVEFRKALGIAPDDPEARAGADASCGAG